MSQVTATEDITLVVLQRAPAEMCFVSSIFTLLSEAGINVDMISQTPPQGMSTTLAFTVLDEDLSGTMDIIGRLREAYTDVKPLFSSGNVKISVADDRMRTQPGFASGLFSPLAERNADVRLVTTSETEISVLVERTAMSDAEQAAKECIAGKK